MLTDHKNPGNTNGNKGWSKKIDELISSAQLSRLSTCSFFFGVPASFSMLKASTVLTDWIAVILNRTKMIKYDLQKYSFIERIVDLRLAWLIDSFICCLQCIVGSQRVVSGGAYMIRGFHISSSFQLSKDKNDALTLYTEADGIRTITLNYAEKRWFN